MLSIQKYTFGMGDRFAHQGEAQLSAILEANRAGIPVFPTWNKSFREHSIVGSQPESLRVEADAAVAALGWKRDYYVDADHIGLNTVDGFLAGSNFFTLDVADFVAARAEEEAVADFIRFCKPFLGELTIPGIESPFSVNEPLLRETAANFLLAARQSGEIYRAIVEKKGGDDFVTEVSIDETDRPQTPVELFLILAMLAREGVPAQTVAPKFTGRFNKGVDYAGDLAQFEKEFEEDIHVIAFAVKTFDLPKTLKLSVHSGSDKFSLYPIMHKLLGRHGCGLHVKTAGTTWLEEVIGLAEAGGDGLRIARAIYREAHEQYEALAAPYATVIDIDRSRLPSPAEVDSWGSATFTRTLRHVQNDPLYNPHFRQLVHVGFKVAAKLGRAYTDALRDHRDTIAGHVRTNLLERHLKPIFPAGANGPGRS